MCFLQITQERKFVTIRSKGAGMIDLAKVMLEIRTVVAKVTFFFLFVCLYVCLFVFVFTLP